MKKFVIMLTTLFLIEMCPISFNKLDANELAKGFFSGHEKKRTSETYSRKKATRKVQIKKKNNKPVNKIVYPF